VLVSRLVGYCGLKEREREGIRERKREKKRERERGVMREVESTEKAKR